MDLLRRQPVPFWLAAAGVAAMLLGTIGPWLEAGGSSGPPVARTRGDFLIALGAVAALFLWQQGRDGPRPSAVGGMVLGALGAFVCGGDVYEILSVPGNGLGPGWGLYVSLLGSLTLAGMSYLAWRDTSY